MKSKEEIEQVAAEYQNGFPSGTARKSSYIAGYNAAMEDAIALAEQCVKVALEKAMKVALDNGAFSTMSGIESLSPSEIVKEVAG